jgi:uncharacterized protein YjeT (DUF2065 family)
MSAVRVSRARLLVNASAVVLVATGLGYLLAPGAALGIVGVEASSTAEFLLRTEGIALLFGAAMLFVVRNGTPATGPLLALAGYYVLSSVVDAVAFAQGIVGPASVPSVVVRVAIGLLCLAAAWRGAR